MATRSSILASQSSLWGYKGRFFSTNSSTDTRDFALGSSNVLAPQWVTGIYDSEGNFSLFVQKTKNGYKFSLSYKVTQKEHSAGILYDLQRYF